MQYDSPFSPAVAQLSDSAGHQPAGLPLGPRRGLVPLSVEQVLSALLGDAPRNITMVVTEWRLPRVLMALLIGAGLGVSGAIFSR